MREQYHICAEIVDDNSENGARMGSKAAQDRLAFAGRNDDDMGIDCRAIGDNQVRAIQ